MCQGRLHRHSQHHRRNQQTRTGNPTRSKPSRPHLRQVSSFLPSFIYFTKITLPKNRFVEVTPLYTPTSDGRSDNIFITRSYDATSHFETVVEDVQDVWKRVIGTDLVLKKREVEVQE